MEEQPLRKMQNSVRFSILHEQSAAKSHPNKTVLGSSRRPILNPGKEGGHKRPQLEKKQHIDQKGFEVMIQELYGSLVALNANFRDVFKKSRIKAPAKQTFTEILSQLLTLYDPNMQSLALSDEETMHLFRDLGS